MNAENTEIIIGPPGTGKTSYLISIMEKEMANGCQPEEIAFVSFTRKAAQEAKERAMNTFRLKDDDFPFFRTIHSLAFRSLFLNNDNMIGKANWDELGEILGLEFKVQALSEDYGDTWLDEIRNSGNQYIYAEGFARARKMGIRQAYERLDLPELNWLEFDRFAKTYNAYKEERGLMDFSDLLAHEDHAPIDLKVVFIDEAQDLSTLQWDFIKRVFCNAKKVFIAGDDDQSIYTWSGADVNHFLTIPGKRKILTQSYRVPRQVYNLANEIVHRIENRIEKKYAPRDEEGAVEYYSSFDCIDFTGEETWLLLARNNYMLFQMAAKVRAQGFLYSFRGASTVSAGHLSAITLWERQRKGQILNDAELKFLHKFLPHDMGEFPDLIWHEVLTGITERDREFYISLLRRGEKITRVPRINISTIHSVKGGEADNVVLVTDMTARTNEAFRMSPDDEHRVWYVAATRAKKALHIIMPTTGNYYTI